MLAAGMASHRMHTCAWRGVLTGGVHVRKVLVADVHLRRPAVRRLHRQAQLQLLSLGQAAQRLHPAATPHNATRPAVSRAMPHAEPCCATWHPCHGQQQRLGLARRAVHIYGVVWVTGMDLDGPSVCLPLVGGGRTAL